jgi:hypothetical protein
MRRNQTRCSIFLIGVAALFAASVLTIDQAAADKIKHSIAVFSGLDKITGRIISFEVATNETVQFGSLQITERVCYTRPPTEAPQTDTFVEVDEVDADNKTMRIFTGWMFAASPGLHALDHPVYDIWLTDCKGDQQVIASPPSTAEAEAPPAEAAKPQEPAMPPQANPKRPVSRQAQGAPQPRGPIEVAPPPGFFPPGAQPPTTQEFIPTTPPPDGTGGF